MNLCEKCTGLCCRYIALPIENPDTKADFEDLRWYLAHEGITIFVEEGEWYINIANRCKFLNKDNMCDIYETRPAICRKYHDKNCDFHSGDYDYELHFTSIEEIDEYIAQKFDKPKKKKK